jgi:hypothetical protein
MSLNDAGLAKQRARTRTYQGEAGKSGSVCEIYSLAETASTWNSAAHELCHSSGINLNDGPRVAIRETGVRLARDAENSQR